MEYKYETHLHTSETSKCASSSGAELAAHFKVLGYAGVFVTDHFFNGNTTVLPGLPWEERVDLFCRGYDSTREKGENLGLDVFLGWEYGLGWAHFLTYGLGKDWLLSNPDMLEWDVLKYFDRVHEDGGWIVHAHPFREGIELVHLAPGKVDAVEIVNAARSDDANRYALDFAASFGLPRTGGSDIHSIKQKRHCGVVTSQRFSGGEAYIAALKSGEAAIFDDTIEELSC